MKSSRLLRSFIGASLAGCIGNTAAAPAVDAGTARQFAMDIAKRHDLDADWVRALLGEAEREDKILDAIAKPAEKKPWHEYRPIFLTDDRIDGGVRFWRENAAALTEAERRHGVDSAIIVAIIGVETRYGKNTGRYRVLDALATLGFGYPPRADFFRSELENFLVLAREAGVDPRTAQGSYAGAMGMPQFMPSSYRRFAVDQDGNGRIDLWQSIPDVVGSVAHYLAGHQWERSAPVAVPATVDGTQWRSLDDGTAEPRHQLSGLRASGVTPGRTVEGDPAATLLTYDDGATGEHWIVFRNFHAITRYNRSVLYAMAVHQLAEAIRERHSRPDTALQ